MIRRLFLWGVGAAAAALCACVLLGPLLIGGRWRADVAPPPADLALSVVRFEAADGVPLVAWMADAEDAKAVVILVSGLGGNRTLAPVPAMMRDLLGRGYTTLALDRRGQGSAGDGPDSPGAGAAAAADVTAAVDWLARHRAGFPVVVLGLGSGGLAALDAAAGDRRIRALVLQDGSTELRRALGRELAARSGLPAPLVRAMLWSGQHIWGRALHSSHPLDAMARYAPRPALLIHGPGTAADSAALAAANPAAQNWQAGPVADYRSYRDAWIDRVAGFLDGLFGTMFG